MSLTLYAHPFAAYCWKTLIALYENAAYSGEDDRLFRRNVTGDSAESAL